LLTNKYTFSILRKVYGIPYTLYLIAGDFAGVNAKMMYPLEIVGHDLLFDTHNLL